MRAARGAVIGICIFIDSITSTSSSSSTWAPGSTSTSMIRPTIGARSSSTVYAPRYEMPTRASYEMIAGGVHRGQAMAMADWLRRHADTRLCEHAVTLSDGRVTLRPLTEDDWSTLLRWNNDPEVLFFSEGDDVTSRTLEEVQAIYRGVSQTAFSFMIEVDGAP